LWIWGNGLGPGLEDNQVTNDILNLRNKIATGIGWLKSSTNSALRAAGLIFGYNPNSGPNVYTGNNHIIIEINTSMVNPAGYQVYGYSNTSQGYTTDGVLLLKPSTLNDTYNLNLQLGHEGTHFVDAFNSRAEVLAIGHSMMTFWDTECNAYAASSFVLRINHPKLVEPNYIYEASLGVLLPPAILWNNAWPDDFIPWGQIGYYLKSNPDYSNKLNMPAFPNATF
jgi:hypothetical protein